MRIIGGEARGRRLLAPKGRETRPTADRVREAIFDLLGPVAGDVRVLDLFAGSGGLALEALSRGAGRAWLVERSGVAWPALLQNVALFRERVELRRQEALAALSDLAASGLRFDLVFLDPPYRSGLLAVALERLAALSLLEPGGKIVAEHAFEVPLVAPGSFRLWKERRYGLTQVTILTVGEA